MQMTNIHNTTELVSKSGSLRKKNVIKLLISIPL